MGLAQRSIAIQNRPLGSPNYTCAAEAVLDSLRTPNNHWLIIACGERQAIESLQHAKHWAQLLKSEIKNSKSEIVFPNGSRITALPAKPETIRGYSANLKRRPPKLLPRRLLKGENEYEYRNQKRAS